MVVRNARTLLGVPCFVSSVQLGSRSGLIGLINFDVKCAGARCVKKTRKRHAVREMKVGPSEPPCRGRLQTAGSCYGPMAAVVNVPVKRRGN